jgi:hypothetical protein
MAEAFRELELLVAKIQKQLAPNAEVLHDVKLDGRQSKVKRQIDVLVRERVGQYEISIIIDCKDYNKPADLKDVEEFEGMLKDVGAQKGVLVCPRGFTEAAKTRAEGLQIELYSPFDTDIHKWTVKATFPAICDFRSVVMAFKISTSAPLPLELELDFYLRNTTYNRSGQSLGTMLNNASWKWNNGQYPNDVGEHLDLAIFGTEPVFIDSGAIRNLRVPVTLSVSIWVKRELCYGLLPVPKISGFKDEFSGKVITNSFQVGLLDPDEITKNWKLIPSEDEAPTRPVIVLVGTVLYGQEGERLHVPAEGGLS